MEIPEQIKSQKEIISVGLLAFGLIEYRNFAEPYSTLIAIGSALPFFLFVFAVQTVAKYQAGIENIMIAEINHDEYVYGESNSGIQFILGRILKIERVRSGRYFVTQLLLPPYVIHPSDRNDGILYTSPTEIRYLLYWVKIPPSMMFTGKKEQVVKWLEEYVKSKHTDRATLDEIDSMTIDGITQPVFEVIEGTESFRFRRGKFSQEEIDQAERLIKELQDNESIKA